MKVESSKKDKPCLTKMMTPPLAWVASGERMPDWQRVKSEHRAKNPGIRRERRVKIGFLDTDKVNRMGQEKMK